MATKQGPQPLPPPESQAVWWPRIQNIFQNMFTDRLGEVRGYGVGIDMNPSLTDGYRFAEQRSIVSQNLYTQGQRGHQSRIPTPQELIRQVTGVGDPTRGR